MNPDKVSSLKAWQFLKSNRLAALATISSQENTPQASLIYYLTDENFHIYIVTSKESRKFKNITKNNKVALVVGQEMDPVVIQLEGTVEMVEDKSKIHELSSRYLEVANKNTKTLNWPPVMKLSVGDGYVIVEVTITHFKFSDFTGLDSFIIEGTPQDWVN